MRPGDVKEQCETSWDVEKIEAALEEAEEQAGGDKTRYDHHQVMREARRQIYRKER
ncbi:hypothetical protein M6D81_04855 [Paenibacillus sp. J5C_2022]|uniref:hypothetical protein n=1 Tax=Paenibacillus sp. J5C2022 TaxID=2977129 RepID=UPI0021D1EAB4|nr:hypothetical protein [Paenibacillus sp. J5C2022]MCU6708036.1 hypothetical protein [Paenibacillus sp. J5C2022]